MSTYTPSFLFDFTFFYVFSGLDNTQLLFIAMVILVSNLYFHMALSKKHLFLSFPLTLLLLGGIGLRISTSNPSFQYIFHYVLFSFLLLILIIDHRLYLFIPDQYISSFRNAQMQVEKVPLPAFNTVRPSSSVSTQGVSPLLQNINDSLRMVKQTLSAKLGMSSPRPTYIGSRVNGSNQSDEPKQCFGNKEKHDEQQSFVHPVEKDADNITTTKELLDGVKVHSFDQLDSKINKTQLGEKSFLDTFFSFPNKQRESAFQLNNYDFSPVLNRIDEGAVIIIRGVVKAANEHFTSLVKQPLGDIIDMEFVHFLAPEGFSSFKSHCSKRLSGEKSQMFNVVLLSKKHDKIPLQATIKPLIINGERVEITIFQRKNT